MSELASPKKPTPPREEVAKTLEVVSTAAAAGGAKSEAGKASAAKPAEPASEAKAAPAPKPAPGRSSAGAHEAFAQPAAAHAADAVRKLRRKRAQALALKVALGVGLPTALSTAYYLGVASEVYESTSLFTVQSADARQTVGLDSIMGAFPATSPGARDTLAVRDYILSRDMLQRLAADHAFVQRFQGERFDWLSRLPHDSSFEDAFEYYRTRIGVEYDSISGVVELKVQGYAAQDAHEFATAIIHYSEEMVNRLSERARTDQTAFAREELSLAEARLLTARQKVLELQTERSEFSPQQSASEALSVRGQLQSQLAGVRAELSQARAYMAESAPKVIALQQQASAIAAQIASESRRLVDPKAESGLNASIASFEAAILEKEFAQSAYQSALTSLELARTEAGRQHRYLALIAAPSRPDEATYPRPVWGILTVFLLSVAAVGITSLFWAAIREHAKL